MCGARCTYGWLGGGRKNSYMCWIEKPQCFGVYVVRRKILKLTLIYKTKQVYV